MEKMETKTNMSTANERENRFIQLKEQYLEKEQSLSRTFSNISTMRVFSFLLGAAGLIVGISEHRTIFVVVGAALMLLFFVLVKLHSDVENEQQHTRYMREVCTRYEKRFGNEWHTFSDDGSSFLDETDCVAQDVDLIGKNSLYQMLSVCHTKIGKERFANRLHERFVSPDLLEKRQKAISSKTMGKFSVV